MQVDAEKIKALMADWSYRLTEFNFISSGGAAKVVCPHCRDEHIGCQFAAGTLSCQRSNCANPHHR